MKLALGTAQFGLPYGIANRSGRVALDETAAIVRSARSAGIRTLDTAIAYGDSELRLGTVGVSDWDVVSKLPAVPQECGNVGDWALESVRASLHRLGVERLYALLLHQPAQLLERRGADLYRALEGIKAAGLAQRIGVSIYDPSELDDLVPNFALDIVQAPFNVVDARLLDSGWLARLADAGIEVHARSVFLQGLLLMPADARPAKFARWNSLLADYDDWVERERTTPPQACLRYVLGFPEIARVIIGVETVNQLGELIDAAAGGSVDAPSHLKCVDADLVNPARWAAL
jgi:aryl-alcohol dehydrogenase-like predicted oxidoreductase